MLRHGDVMDPFDWSDFDIGFWQAFGTFGGQTAESIIRSKDAQLAEHSWTLWSFSAGAQEDTLRSWLDRIDGNDPWVLLAHSRGAAEPQGKRTAYRKAREYRELDGDWKPIPEEAKTGLHLKPGKLGAAYVVREQSLLRFYYDQPDLGLSWYPTSAGSWKRTHLPPRPPTFLIRRGGNARPRLCSAVMKLKAPFLVQVR